MRPLASHAHSRGEALQPEPRDIRPSSDRRVGGIQDLEAPVEQEPVDLVGALAPAHPVVGLEHDHVASGLREARGATEPGEPRAHDDHVGVEITWHPGLLAGRFHDAPRTRCAPPPTECDFCDRVRCERASTAEIALRSSGRPPRGIRSAPR